jgi:hypothetical protein
MASNSVKGATARALGVSPVLIPERLRNRLNGYLWYKTIPQSIIDDAPEAGESVNYTPKPIQSGSHTYLRNIVILDTLFDDPKLVKQLMLNELKGKKLDDCLTGFLQLNAAKLDLLKSMQPMQESILSFLKKTDIDWHKEELPYPYTDGEYASPLIAANLNQDTDLSVYDEALKFFLSKKYKEALQLIENQPSHFTSSESSLLKSILMQKKAEHTEYADYLAKFS